jgi:ADP-ribose pyrophosphatase YjhB (NUDIX family)
MILTVRRAVNRIVLTTLYELRRAFMRLRSSLTLGVRCIVTRTDGHVLLVRHSYSPGWQLPGGGVKHAEGAESAIVRELQEEAGVTPLERPRLYGVYSNFALWNSDHVVVYTLEQFEFAPRTHWEIAEVGFFDPKNLPQGTTPGTVRRLEEWRERQRPDREW